ncbi:MAG: hypothetical protein AAFQ43_07335 [Bacteroidota bacterium]
MSAPQPTAAPGLWRQWPSRGILSERSESKDLSRARITGVD